MICQYICFPCCKKIYVDDDDDDDDKNPFRVKGRKSCTNHLGENVCAIRLYQTNCCAVYPPNNHPPPTIVESPHNILYIKCNCIEIFTRLDVALVDLFAVRYRAFIYITYTHLLYIYSKYIPTPLSLHRHIHHIADSI